MKLLLKGISSLGMVIPIVSGIGLLLDSLVYQLAHWALKAFFEIASYTGRFSISSVSQINDVISRIMVLVGIFALFRVSIMLITYLVFPEKYEELSKSSSSIVTNIVIAIVLLISCPFIFRVLGDFENLIFTNEVIPKLVYGPDQVETQLNNPNNPSNSWIENQSLKFVNNTFLIFYRPDPINKCVNNDAGDCGIYNQIMKAENDKGISNLIFTDPSNFNYYPFISFLVGCMLVYYFLSYAIGLGVRLFKLIVLQVIYPIPIIMSVDPSRKKQLETFALSYISIYTQIFVRVFTFYLAFLVLDSMEAILDVVNQTSSTIMLISDNIVVDILLIFAVFQAANELPKLIEETLDLKLGLSESSKGFGSMLKGIIGGTAGFVGGGIIGGIQGRSFGAAVAGATTGMVGAGMAAASGANVWLSTQNAFKAISGTGALGRKIHDSGGLINYGYRGAQNMLGFGGRDAATLKKYDSMIERHDKAIQADNEVMDIRNRADQLRDNITSSIDVAFAASGAHLTSADDFISHDVEYLRLKADYERHYGAQGDRRADNVGSKLSMEKLDRREMELRNEYKLRRSNFARDQFTRYQNRLQGIQGPTAAANPEFIKALENYNSYINANSHINGMQNLQIKSWAGQTDGLLATTNINEKARLQIQEDIDKHTADKKKLEADRKAFSSRDDVKQRKKRAGGEQEATHAWGRESDWNTRRTTGGSGSSGGTGGTGGGTP